MLGLRKKLVTGFYYYHCYIITIITIIIINSVLVQWMYSRFGANQFPLSENEKEMLRRP